MGQIGFSTLHGIVFHPAFYSIGPHGNSNDGESDTRKGGADAIRFKMAQHVRRSAEDAFRDQDKGNFCGLDAPYHAVVGKECPLFGCQRPGRGDICLFLCRKHGGRLDISRPDCRFDEEMESLTQNEVHNHRKPGSGMGGICFLAIRESVRDHRGGGKPEPRYRLARHNAVVLHDGGIALARPDRTPLYCNGAVRAGRGL